MFIPAGVWHIIECSMAQTQLDNFDFLFFYLEHKNQSLSFELVTLSGECGLTRRSGAATGNGGKPIIKIRKLNLRLLRRRETAVQRTPPRTHLPGADYAT
jgi:hypothetical protein